MKLSLIQSDIAWNEPRKSLTGCYALAERAIEQGGKLLVFPEMFPCGFSMPVGDEARAYGDEGKAFLKELAAKKSVHAVGSVPEVDADGSLYNTAWLFRPNGESVSYRKIHLFSYGDETSRYSGGKQLLSTTVEGMRCSIFICYDLRFTLPFFSLAQETDIFIIMANWPASRREHWLTLLRARAIEYQCYVAGVNRVGSGGGLSYSGDSALFAPDGKQLVVLGDQAEVATAEVDPDAVASWRESFPALRDRQLGLYSTPQFIRGRT